jgi:hypothetical protein
MAAQEAYATEAHLVARGASHEVVTAALEKQDALITLVRDGAEFEIVQELAGAMAPARETVPSSNSSGDGSITTLVQRSSASSAPFLPSSAKTTSWCP